MNNFPLDEFPIETSIHRELPIAMFDYQSVISHFLMMTLLSIKY